MKNLASETDRRTPSASELRKLPPDERSAILQSQAALAEADYRLDPELRDFEAFDEVAPHADGPIPEEG